MGMLSEEVRERVCNGEGTAKETALLVCQIIRDHMYDAAVGRVAVNLAQEALEKHDAEEEREGE